MNTLSIIALVMASVSLGATLGRLMFSRTHRDPPPQPDRPQWKKIGPRPDPSVLKGRYRDLYP